MPLRIYSRERDERRMIIILYFGTLVLMLILLYATYTNMRHLRASSDELRRYDSALLELAAMRADLTDRQSAVDGFILTGDTVYLASLDATALRSPLPKAQLDSLLPEPSWKAQLNALYRAGDRVRAHLATTLEVRQKADRSPQFVNDEISRGRVARERFLTMYAGTLSTLQGARSPLLEGQRADGFSAPIMLFLYSALAIAATALLFWRVSRALSSTEKAKFDLHLKFMELDTEVKNRTSIQTMLQRVLDTSPNGIMTFASVRDERGRIIDFEFLSTNRQAELMVKRTDLVGKRLLEEMPENRKSGLFDAYVDVVESGVAYRNEFHYEEGDIRTWFANHAVRLEDGFMVTFSDISEQRRAQEVNAEADRLELTNQITRTVAHEVRNPLTNIQLATEQLHDEVEDREEEVKPFFEIIDRNVKRIGGLINGMLESSRKRELVLVPCTLKDIVENAMEQVNDRLELKQVKGQVQVADDLPEVLADCELINMAIINIAINAVEAMEEDKGTLEMRAFRAGDEVLLEISDNGKGIPPQDLTRLFEPFYSGRSGGLGLGLTTTRSILNSHRIKLEVRSKVGEGTTFILRFPSTVFVPVPDRAAAGPVV
jgi:signal transduction histidine kinase